MLKKIQKLDNKLIQAQLLAYLINNKKVSKVLKSNYIKYFTKLFEELPKYYNSFQYEVDMKTFFNTDETSNNVIPNFISSTNYIDYTMTLNYTIKNKHLVETILESYNLPLTDIYFKNMKKLLSGKINIFEFVNEYGEHVIVNSSDLEGRDFTQKNFKEQLKFHLPNTIASNEIEKYPLVFTYVTSTNSTVKFNIFS